MLRIYEFPMSIDVDRTILPNSSTPSEKKMYNETKSLEWNRIKITFVVERLKCQMYWTEYFIFSEIYTDTHHNELARQKDGRDNSMRHTRCYCHFLILTGGKCECNLHKNSAIENWPIWCIKRSENSKVLHVNWFSCSKIHFTSKNDGRLADEMWPSMHFWLNVKFACNLIRLEYAFKWIE